MKSRGMMGLLFVSLLGCGAAETPAQPAHIVHAQARPLSAGSTQRAANASGSERGSNQERAAYTQGFMEGCVGACTEGSALCTPYCSCMNTRVLRDGQGAHIDALAPQGNEALMRDPWFRQAFAACGPDMHDAAFLRGCLSSCPNCGPYCQCAIDHIRAGMSREEGTLFFLDHIDSGVSEAGQNALNAAIQACMPLRPPS